MSRSRNASSPFYATALSRMQAGPRNIVRELDAAFRRSGLGLLWPGSGWRTGSVEHNSGRAIDYMVSSQVGRVPTDAEHAQAMRAINWLIANREALGVHGILYSTDRKRRTQVIGYSQPFSRGWRNLAARGSVSADHVDHFHVLFNSGASWPSSLNGVLIGGSGNTTPVSPNLPSTGVNNKTVAQMASEIIAGKHGTGHTNRQNSLGIDNSTYAEVRAEVNKRTGTTATTTPAPVKVPNFPKGIGPGKSSPSAIPLQRQLKKAGFMSRSVKENANYGPRTRSAVARFHNKHRQFRSSGVSHDTKIGPKGWDYLFRSY